MSKTTKKDSVEPYSEAKKRIANATRENATTLDLKSLGLKSLPPEIGALTALTSLVLSHNNLTALPPEIGALKALTKLNLDCNQLTELLPEIEALTALTSLVLSHNNLTALPPEIGALKALTKLNLDCNQLTELPPEIGALTALTELNLFYNLLTSMPLEIVSLTALTSLVLESNELTALPPEIGALKALTKLNLDCNQLTELPPEIKSLTALKELYLDRNQLTELPPEIGALTALTRLDVVGNHLTALPPKIKSLTALQELYLHGNDDLGIPYWVLGPTYEEINSHDVEKMAAKPRDILNFYFEKSQAAVAGTLRAIQEIKVMLVGRGGAGKTSLRRFFLKQSHDMDEKETPGIALDTFPLDCQQGELTVRLWDFAGQEITHALHQFFLTEGCVYLLVLDPRSNTEMQDAEYWLGLLQRYAGKSPVLLVLNRQDARQGGYEVDRCLLQERFPLIHSFTRTNCESRNGCDQLLRRLREAVEALPSTAPPHLQVPEAWLNVMCDCVGAGSDRQHMTMDEFREICAKRGEVEPDKQESLARLLHKLGVVLHFVEDPRLRDTSVLNPHWVTDGVYRLLRFKDRPESDGLLSLREALDALSGEDEHDARFLLRLMERFEMCFPVDEEVGGMPPTMWLIPGALNAFQPEGASDDWQQPGGVRLRYVYDPLPEGVLPRFIVRTHLLSEQQMRWRNGVVLTEGQARALVRRGANRNHVEVTAFGWDADRLRLLQIIQGNFEAIHADLPDPKPFAELELTVAPGVFRRVADLKAAESNRIMFAADYDRDKRPIEPAPQLNRTSEPQARTDKCVPLRLFLSYSHKDKRAKQIFQDNLTVMQQKTLITSWHDGLIEPGMRWKEEIEENLSRMDVFVGLLTTAFLASDFIQEVELGAARQKLRADEHDFLFVLILVDDIRLDALDLSDYLILKPGGRAVRSYATLKVGFNKAQRELELLLIERQVERRGNGTKSAVWNPAAIESIQISQLGPPRLEIKSLTIKNFCCFENKRIEFAKAFNLFIGDNGSGKTSVLKALAVSLGSWFLGLPDAEAKRNIFRNEVRFRSFLHGDTHTREEQWPVVVSCEGAIYEQTGEWTRELESPEGHTTRKNAAWIANIATDFDEKVQRGLSIVLPVIVYYGTGRLWQKQRREPIELLSPESRFEGYLDCLESSSNEAFLLAFFKTKEMQSLQEKRSIAVFEAVRQAIIDCIDHATDVRFNIARNELLLCIHENEIPFHNLSDGYRNMLAMVADIAVRCATLNPALNENAIRDTPGVVLIDEIDLHLHPKWQRRVVTDLRNAFPKIQFIATTHSPFIIQSLLPEEGVQLLNLDDEEANDFADKSIEDIAEDVQGVENPSRSRRYREMMLAAEKYYRALQQAATPIEIQVLKDKLDELASRFSDDPAYHAILKVEREARLKEIGANDATN